MTEFLAIVTSLPAAPFTLAAALSVAFWAVSLTGGFGQDGDADLAGDGPGDGVGADGGAEGAEVGGEAGSDVGGHDGGDVGSHDGGEVGGADAPDGGSDAGHPEADAGEPAHGPAAPGGPTLASVLGLGRVPLTLWMTLFSLFGWVAAFAAGWLARNGGLEVGRIVSVPAGLAVGVLAGAAAARFGSAPLAPLFAHHPGRSRASLVGETAEITTGRVDGRFGQARVLLGGDDLVVQVRCDEPGVDLGRAARALIVGWDPSREAYVVEPIDRPRRAAARRAQASARS